MHSFFSLEAPLPNGGSYKSFLMRHKIAQKKRFNNTGSNKSAIDSFAAATPQIVCRFGLKRFLGNGFLVDVFGGIPNVNTLAVSDGGVLLAGINSRVYTEYVLKTIVLLISSSRQKSRLFNRLELLE